MTSIEIDVISLIVMTIVIFLIGMTAGYLDINREIHKKLKKPRKGKKE